MRSHFRTSDIPQISIFIAFSSHITSPNFEFNVIIWYYRRLSDPFEIKTLCLAPSLELLDWPDNIIFIILPKSYFTRYFVSSWITLDKSLTLQKKTSSGSKQLFFQRRVCCQLLGAFPVNTSVPWLLIEPMTSVAQEHHRKNTLSASSLIANAANYELPTKGATEFSKELPGLRELSFLLSCNSITLTMRPSRRSPRTWINRDLEYSVHQLSNPGDPSLYSIPLKFKTSGFTTSTFWTQSFKSKLNHHLKPTNAQKRHCFNLSLQRYSPEFDSTPLVWTVTLGFQ